MNTTGSPTTIKLNVPQQTHTPLETGANSPQQSAIMKIDNMNQKQAGLNNAVGGKRKKKGGAPDIQVPPTNTSSYNVNGAVKATLTSNLTSQANAEYDNGAYKGGKTKRRRTKRRSKKTRRHRSRKYRRH